MSKLVIFAIEMFVFASGAAVSDVEKLSADVESGRAPVDELSADVGSARVTPPAPAPTAPPS